MEVKELGHLVLYVRDIDQSAAFYRDVLGWRQIVPDPDPDDATATATATTDPRFPIAAFSAPGGRTHHELLLIEVGPTAASVPHGRRVGMYHFGLKVGDSDEELVDAWRTVAAAGATIVGTGDHTVTHSLYIEDPDGNEVELYIDVPGVDWRNDPSLIAAPVKPLDLSP